MNEQVRLSDLAVLLVALQDVARHSVLDLHDADRTADQLSGQLDRKVNVDRGLLQSIMYAANMLDERGEFWHPKGLSFQAFVKQIVGPTKRFDKTYHLIVEDKDYG